MKKNSAFSLVELSIVLVILGLLTGGILTGQSLIRAAELRTVTTEYQNWVTAARTFQSKYFSLPGDMGNAGAFWGYPSANATNCPATAGTGTQTCDGDVDGLIEDSGGADEYSEDFMFWQHLANAGLIEGTYSGISGPDGTHDYENGNSPSSKLNNAIWGIEHMTDNSGNGSRFNINYGNVFMIGGQGTGNSRPNQPVMTPEEAWNIDTKTDDGMPATGNVIAYGLLNCTLSANANDLTGEYALTNTATECGLHMMLR